MTNSEISALEHRKVKRNKRPYFCLNFLQSAPATLKNKKYLLLNTEKIKKNSIQEQKK